MRAQITRELSLSFPICGVTRLRSGYERSERWVTLAVPATAQLASTAVRCSALALWIFKDLTDRLSSLVRFCSL
jgi:hypothetical protein